MKCAPVARSISGVFRGLFLTIARLELIQLCRLVLVSSLVVPRLIPSIRFRGQQRRAYAYYPWRKRTTNGSTVWMKHEKEADDSDSLTDHNNNARQHLLMRLTLGLAVSQALATLVQLKIPDLFVDSSKSLSLSYIAKATNSHPDSLLRILRLLVNEGIIIIEESRKDNIFFRLGATGELLRTNTSNGNKESVGMGNMVKYCLDKPVWNAWACLPDSLSDGDEEEKEDLAASSSSPFYLANGMTTAEYYSRSENRQSLESANAFVKYIADWEVETCVESIDWPSLLYSIKERELTTRVDHDNNNNKRSSTITTILDLGGYHGAVLEAVRHQYSELPFRYICLDLPHVVEEQTRNGSEKKPVMEDDVRLVGGDMFDSQTFPECDVIFMKHILLCEFGEKESLQILKSCHEALYHSGTSSGVGGRVIIAEAVLPDADKTSSSTTRNGAVTKGTSTSSLPFYVDVMMMLDGHHSQKDGRPRTRAVSEWSAFVQSAGFRLEKVIHTSCPTCSIFWLCKR